MLNKQNENTILSPFLVKLLLSILGEAAGEGTSTNRELQSVLPSVQSTAETRELYGKAFGSMLVSLRRYTIFAQRRAKMRDFPKIQFSNFCVFVFFSVSKKIPTTN